MITVIGLGFVGLTTALGFAHKGLKVYGYDIAESKLQKIRDGEIPFFEPGLKEILDQENGKNFTTVSSLEEAVNNSQVIFYCVGTPSDKNGSADLTYLYKAVESTLKLIKKSDKKVLVVKSTVPPSTTSEKVKPFVERFGFTAGEHIGLANNPEFLREGYAWDDFINPDRIVIGTGDDISRTNLKELYAHFDAPLHFVSLNTGEYIKYLSNTLLSTLISFANEQSMIAYKVGEIDIPKAFKILHEDKRWSGSPAKMTSYVYPGCGFGGYCLPKDTSALVSLAGEAGLSAELLSSVLAVNEKVRKFHVERISREIKKDKKLAVLGLAFKPDSDDVRASPAAFIIQGLLDEGFSNIAAYDPIAGPGFDREFGLPLQYAESMEEVVDGAEAVVITTAWKEFREKKNLLDSKIIYDLRYMFS